MFCGWGCVSVFLIHQPLMQLAIAGIKLMYTPILIFWLATRSSSLDSPCWCVCTGDVASIDSFGYMRIQDRSKDVVKSGGEWISSIQLENAAMGHPKVPLPHGPLGRHTCTCHWHVRLGHRSHIWV